MSAIKNMIYLGDISEKSKTVVDPDRSSTSVPYATFNERNIADITSLKAFINAEQDLHGYFHPWPSGGNWDSLSEEAYELGGVRKNYPVGSLWERVKATVGEEEYYFRVKDLVYSITGKPFSVSFNSDVYQLGICLFSEGRYLGETNGWIDFLSASPYTFSRANSTVSEFAFVIKRTDGAPVTEDDFKDADAEYEPTQDATPQQDKMYYTRSGYEGQFVYTEFTGTTFDPNVIYYELKSAARQGINIRYRIGPEENICPIAGRTSITLSHTWGSPSTTSTYSDDWSQDVGPIYGGHYSFIDGRLLSNAEPFRLTSSWLDSNTELWQLVDSEKYKILAINVPSMHNIPVVTQFMCSALEQKLDFETPDRPFMYRNNAGKEFNIELWLNEDTQNINGFKTWLNAQANANHPLTFIFKKAYVRYDRTPFAISGKSGLNTFWADSGNIKELVYHTTHQELVKESSLTEIYNDAITDIQIDTAVSMVGDELFIDQFVPTIWYYVWNPYIINPYDEEDNVKGFVSSDGKIICSKRNYDIRKVPYGSKVTYYSNDTNVGEFFCKNVERVGKSTYKINAMSAIGLMDQQYHVGGIYTGESFTEVLADILGPNYEYTVDGLVAAVSVYGWLPYDTKRNNLHQLIMAYGVNIVKGDNGKMFFTFLEDAATPEEIAQSHIFTGGSIRYDEPASRIELTEHEYHYVDDVAEEVLFDNVGKDGVINSLITFDHPIYPESVYTDGGGITVNDVGVNYAWVTGAGVVKGKPYTHNMRILSEDNIDAPTDKVIKVEDATLVTMMNSENVLLRLSQFYFNATTVEQDIEVTKEKAGDRYIMHNAFHEYLTGFITRMSTSVSSFRRASCEIIQNYIPIGQGASYTHRQIIDLDTGARTAWTIPSEVREKDKQTVRVVLIGFGDDGYPGEPGEDGHQGSENAVSLGGTGGLGGEGGNGGKVLPITLLVDDVTEIEFYNEGRDSVLDCTKYHFSSADGSTSSNGYYDPYSGDIYAVPGKAGHRGGNGGNGGQMKPKVIEIPATPGEDIEYEGVVYHGGAVGPHSTINGGSVGISSNITIYFAESGGGGAAVGSDGGDGSPFIVAANFGDPHPGHGANGANAEETAGNYGNGGNGGHGGGGGGGAALSYWYNQPYDYVDLVTVYDPGRGGLGGLGSHGHFGCAIIYW